MKLFESLSKFLEEYPLHKKLDLQSLVPPGRVRLADEAYRGAPRNFGAAGGTPSISGTLSVHMACPNCRSDQTFTLVEGQKDEGPARKSVPMEDGIWLFVFLCASCQQMKRRFLVQLQAAEKEWWIQKFGQWPEWQVKVSPREGGLLGPHELVFKKGLACEREGFGIGAAAYYRRIVEGVIGELLDSIQALLDEPQQQAYGEALAKLRQETIAADKIKCVKDYLPRTLRPGGINPLDVLYEALSRGIHAGSDEEALDDAAHIRGALLFLLGEVASHKERAKEFLESTQRLLKKRSTQAAEGA